MNTKTENPFADDPVDGDAVDGDAVNPYGAAADTTYKPVYDRTLYPRTATIVSMSVFCFILAFLCELTWWTSVAFFFLPLAIVSLIVAACAMWLGSRDLAAMRSGVMSSDRRTLIRTSVVASTLALFVIVGRVVYFIVLAFRNG